MCFHYGSIKSPLKLSHLSETLSLGSLLTSSVDFLPFLAIPPGSRLPPLTCSAVDLLQTLLNCSRTPDYSPEAYSSFRLHTFPTQPISTVDNQPSCCAFVALISFPCFPPYQSRLVSKKKLWQGLWITVSLFAWNGVDETYFDA